MSDQRPDENVNETDMPAEDENAAFEEPSVAAETETETPAEMDELAALRAERDAWQDRYTRALAEAENARKRSERDRREAENYGGSKLARDLLPVYDNLQRAMTAAEEEQGEASQALSEGVELTMRELLNIFSRHGIERLSPEVGTKFDPQLHEAMFEAPVSSTAPGHIIQVMVEGFMLHDRLLRPAQVGVASAAAS